MYREESLEEISDGKLYTANDMVKTDTAGCVGCTEVCCHGMGSSIVLEPYDVYRLTTGLGKIFEELLGEGLVEINVVDGIMLPNMKMNPDTGSCAFLDGTNRCTIHGLRPGVCRLFPLGRYWEDVTHYKYILQKGQCHKDNLTKIKVKRWIGSEPAGYDEYVSKWHAYLVRIKQAVAQIQAEGKNFAGNGADNVALSETAATQIRTICMYTLKMFYMTPYSTRVQENGDAAGAAFEEIGHRIDEALKAMGMD